MFINEKRFKINWDICSCILHVKYLVNKILDVVFPRSVVVGKSQKCHGHFWACFGSEMSRICCYPSGDHSVGGESSGIDQHFLYSGAEWHPSERIDFSVEVSLSCLISAEIQSSGIHFSLILPSVSQSVLLPKIIKFIQMVLQVFVCMSKHGLHWHMTVTVWNIGCESIKKYIYTELNTGSLIAFWETFSSFT